MTFNVIVSADFHVQCAPVKPIRNDGIAVAAFLPGWRPRVVYTALEQINLLALEHDDGSWAVWFLDKEMNRVGSSMAELSPAVRNRLLSNLCGLFDGIWQTLVVAASPNRLTEMQRSFVQLPLEIRRQILDVYLGRSGFSTSYESLSDQRDAPGTGKLVDLGSRRIVLDPAYLYPLTDPNALQQAYINALQKGVFTWPSPIGGHESRVTQSYCLGGNRFAYRLVDECNDITFYFIADEIYFRIACIYIPQARLAVANDADHVRALMPDLSRAMFYHAIEYAEPLESYLAVPAQKFVHAWRGLTAMHLGHVLWNDISGIGNLVAAVPAAHLPQHHVYDAPVEPEMYGQLDEIFPELHGKVVRHAGTFQAAIPSFYSGHSLLMKSAGMQVTASVRERIVTRLLSKAEYSDCLEACRTAARDNGPIVVLGMRTENRTLTDFPGFCTRLLDFLIQRFPSMTLVVDGHNSRSGGADQFFWSHGEINATRSPISMEQEIALALQRQAVGSGIKVVSNIGLPLAYSLLWGMHCLAFVTPWGAGLAKYRWICNKPGLVLTSRWNLQNLGDLHIYDAEHFLEGSAPIEFIDPANAHDRPDAPLMVRLGDGANPSIMNFDVDEQAVFESIGTMLERYAYPAAVS